MVKIDVSTLTKPDGTPNDYVNSNSHNLSSFTLKTDDIDTSGLLVTGNWSYGSTFRDISITTLIIGESEIRNTVGVKIQALMPDETTEAALYHTKLIGIYVWGFWEAFNILDFANDTTLDHCFALGRPNVGIRIKNTYMTRIVSSSFEVFSGSTRSETYAMIIDGTTNTSLYGVRLELHGVKGTDYGRIKSLATDRINDGVNLIGVETTNNSGSSVILDSLMENAVNVVYIDKGLKTHKILSGARNQNILIGAGEAISEAAGGYIELCGNQTDKKGRVKITGGNNLESKVEIWGSYGGSSITLFKNSSYHNASYYTGVGAKLVLNSVVGRNDIVITEKSITFNLPEHLNNEDAISSGLVIGQSYWNTTAISGEKVLLKVR